MIPQRLGVNEALDTSVKALISTHTYYCLRQENITEALTKYSRALYVLRVSLDDPIQARTPEVLCAVYLLLICQGLLGTYEGRWTGHGKGAAQILKARGYYNPQDDFEAMLLLSLRGPVLFEGLLNDEIRFSSSEWKILVENKLDGSTQEGQMMRCLARYPDLMQRGRSIGRGGKDHVELLEELRAHRQTLKVILTELRSRLAVVQGLIDNGNSQTALVVQTHAHYQRTYGLGLVICVIASCVLNAVDVGNTQLVSESIYFSKELLALADSAGVYRPLGASYVVTCLVAAWVGTTDCSIKTIVERRLVEYQDDFAYRQVSIPTSELERISRHLRLFDPDPC